MQSNSDEPRKQLYALLGDLPDRLRPISATVMSTGGEAGTVPLPVLRDCLAVTMPLCAVQSFYMAVHRLAKARGFDPDTPIHLRKVTETM